MPWCKAVGNRLHNNLPCNCIEIAIQQQVRCCWGWQGWLPRKKAAGYIKPSLQGTVES